MSAQYLAEVITDIRSLILLAASLVCCFGLVHCLLGKKLYRKRQAGSVDWGELSLAGGIAALVCLFLSARPMLLFVPIVLFLFVWRSDKENDGNC